MPAADEPWPPGSEAAQGVDPQVPGEEHVQAAEPEELAAVAGHGFLGLGHLLAGEHEEGIAGEQQGAGQVQQGDVLPQPVHRLQCEHLAPFRELPFCAQGPGGRIQGHVVAVTTHSACVEGHHQVDAVQLYVPEEDVGHPPWVPPHSRVVWEVPVVNDCYAGGWDPQHVTALQEFFLTNLPLIVVISCREAEQGQLVPQAGQAQNSGSKEHGFIVGVRGHQESAASASRQARLLLTLHSLPGVPDPEEAPCQDRRRQTQQHSPSRGAC